MGFIKSAFWLVAGMVGSILMIISGITLIAVCFFTKSDLTLQNIALLAAVFGLFCLGAYLHIKNMSR